MRKLLTEILNLIFPPRDKERLLQEAVKHHKQLTFSPGQHESVTYLSSYKDPLIKATITENKFHNNPVATELLGDLFNKWAMLQDEDTVYIPIPLGPLRLKRRGYNQVEKILETVNKKIKIGKNILMRPIDTEPQSELPKSKRQKNMQGAFTYVNQAIDLNDYSQVVLVDDVITTGATMKAAAEALSAFLPEHIKLTCVALAH